MRQVIALFLAVFLCVNLFGCSKKESDSENRYEPQYIGGTGDFQIELFDDCFIIDGGVGTCWLEYQGKQLLDGTFYSYGFSESKQYVFIHNIQVDHRPNISDRHIVLNRYEHSLLYDEYYIFNAKTNQLVKYNNYKSFFKAVQSRKIGKWYYRDWDVSFRQIATDVTLWDIGEYRGQKLFYKGLPLLEGYISDIKIIDKHTISFQFVLADSNYPQEFIGITNQGLDFKRFAATGKQDAGRIFLFFHECFDKTYQATLTLDTQTGTLTESHR